MQAFQHQAEVWRAAGRPVMLAQLRAFIEGWRGRRPAGQARVQQRWNLHGYEWPAEIPGWSLVVCTYPDGPPEFDYVDLSESSFWTAENGFLDDLPLEATDDWLRQMGFEVLAHYELDIAELPDTQAPAATKTQRHLWVVSRQET